MRGSEFSTEITLLPLGCVCAMRTHTFQVAVCQYYVFHHRSVGFLLPTATPEDTCPMHTSRLRHVPTHRAGEHQTGKLANKIKQNQIN